MGVYLPHYVTTVPITVLLGEEQTGYHPLKMYKMGSISITAVECLKSKTTVLLITILSQYKATGAGGGEGLNNVPPQKNIQHIFKDLGSDRPKIDFQVTFLTS